MRTGLGFSVLLGGLVGLLCVTLAVGPAAADPRLRVAQAQPDPDDVDGVPTPPPPPVVAPAPAPPLEAAPPAPPVVVLPAAGYQYGGAYGGMPPAVLYARGQSLRSIGMPLTFAGIGLFVLSIALLWKAVDLGTCSYYDTTLGRSTRGCNDSAAVNYAVGGVFAMLGSLTGIGVGIPLWAVGSHRMNKAIQMGHVPTYAAPLLTPTHGGLIGGLRLKTF
ncbi:MAG TPA: hypothetical protein VGQ83_14570 [Polyangia bacterium]|jgi:hypothetical protein